MYKIENIRPLGSRVAVVRTELNSRSAGGLILSSPEPENTGTVVAVGAGRYNNGVLVPMSVRVGDKVMFGPYAGNNTLQADDKEVMLIDESELTCVIGE